MSTPSKTSIFAEIARISASQQASPTPEKESTESPFTKEEIQHVTGSEAEGGSVDSEGSPERPATRAGDAPSLTGTEIDPSSPQFLQSLMGYLMMIHTEVTHLSENMVTTKDFCSENHDFAKNTADSVKGLAEEIQDVQAKLEMLGTMLVVITSTLNKLEKNQALMMKGSLVSQKPEEQRSQDVKGRGKGAEKGPATPSSGKGTAGEQVQPKKDRSALLSALAQYRTGGDKDKGGK